VLYSYQLNGELPVAEQLSDPRVENLTYFVAAPRRLHSHFYPVAQQLKPGRRGEYPALLWRLSTDNGDPTVSLVAAKLRQSLAQVDPDNTPIAPGVVRAQAGCGDRVDLWAAADVTLPLRVRVLGTASDATYYLIGNWYKQEIPFTLRLPPGTVVVTYGNREVARLADRPKTRCP
jgi:hypothetical protein